MSAGANGLNITRQNPFVYVLDDEPEVLNLVGRALKRAGFTIRGFSTCGALFEALHAAEDPVDVVLTDLHLPDGSGLDVLDFVAHQGKGLSVVLMTGRATIETAITAIRKGAYDYLVKPFDPIESLAATVSRAAEHQRLKRRNRYLEQRIHVSERFQGTIAASKGMRQVLNLVQSVAPTDATVLIYGESGTGKELIARAVHERSERADRPYVVVNCGAFSETLLESELFGHVKGSFTGAASSRVGLFEEASGGTLFLDEIGELTPSFQVKLLRVLQEGEIRPVGANTSRLVDVRIVTATHRNLRALVETGEFRQDLYYRLNVFQIAVPPLRDRKVDIAPLVHSFIDKHGARLGSPAKRISESALDLLQAHDWPGNVRELENAIERALILTKTDTIEPDALPPDLREIDKKGADSHLFHQPLSEAKSAFERQYLERLMTQAHGNASEAARLAQLDRSNLKRLLKRHEIDPKGRG